MLYTTRTTNVSKLWTQYDDPYNRKKQELSYTDEMTHCNVAQTTKLSLSDAGFSIL